MYLGEQPPSSEGGLLFDKTDGPERLREMLRGKRAVFFDLDGTLIDSIGVWNETDRLLARELTGREPDETDVQRFRERALERFGSAPDTYLRYCGLLRERYATDMTAQAIYARRSAIAAGLLAERVTYKAGAADLLRALKA